MVRRLIALVREQFLIHTFHQTLQCGCSFVGTVDKTKIGRPIAQPRNPTTSQLAANTWVTSPPKHRVSHDCSLRSQPTNALRPSNLLSLTRVRYQHIYSHLCPVLDLHTYIRSNSEVHDKLYDTPTNPLTYPHHYNYTQDASRSSRSAVQGRQG